jgi:hypothetical protein
VTRASGFPTSSDEMPMMNAHKAERTPIILGDAVFTGSELNLHSPYYIPAHISEPTSDVFTWVFDNPESASKNRAGLFLRNARDVQALESSDFSPPVRCRRCREISTRRPSQLDQGVRVSDRCCRAAGGKKHPPWAPGQWRSSLIAAEQH